MKYGNDIEKYISKEIDSSNIEKLHTKFCKYVLGVRKHASNDGCRGEFGCIPILYHTLFNMVKYWCHIVKSDNQENSLIYEAFKASEKMAKENKDSWVRCVHIFKYLNLKHIFDNPGNFKPNYIINIVKSKLFTKFCNIWKSKLCNDSRKNPHSGNKLRLYRKFKTNFKFEPYLLILNKGKHWQN